MHHVFMQRVQLPLLFCCSHQWLAGYHHLLQHQRRLSCGHADTHHHVYCSGCALFHRSHKGDLSISTLSSTKFKLLFLAQMSILYFLKLFKVKF